MENIFENKPERLCLHCGKCNGEFVKTFYEKPPENCGYEGWFFVEWEKYKQNIRKLKERLLILNVQLKKANSTTKAKKISQDIQKIKEKLINFEKIGPTDL